MIENIKLKTALSVFKYIFFIFLILQVAYIYKSPFIILNGVLELFFVFLICLWISSKNKMIGYIFNICILFAFGIELIVYRFAGRFVSLIMVTNLNSIQGISGKLFQYVIYSVFFGIAIFIPVPQIIWNKKKFILFVFVFASLLFSNKKITETNYSPIGNAIQLISDGYYRAQLYDKIAQSGNSDFGTLNDMFYKSSVGDYVKSPFDDKPDIVLIFTEGLSQNIIDDSRDITPNIKKYQEKSLNFTNYYNHTAATYRGIIGQLFSGHQYNNNDENTLISLQDILHNNGYYTTMINTEPNNADFTEYLEKLHFDEIVTKEENTWLRDDVAYELLENEVMNKYENNIPDLIVIYTFGTHATYDDTRYKFGDGKNGLLNRFANADHYFGEFMSKFDNINQYKDLVIVFTSDHCTYEDEDFTKTFEPEYSRYDFFCDKIPFFIWNNKVTPNKIDANGRNSLCMAPTILDYLDIDGENYFLGDSLFSENDTNNLLDKVYSIPDEERYRITDETSIRELKDVEEDVVAQINSYLSYTIKAKKIVE